MIVEYIRYQTRPERAAEVVAAYRAAMPRLRAAPECLSQEVAVCEEDAGAVTVRLGWTSTQAHLQGFRRGPPFLALVRPFVPDIVEMRHYRVVSE